MLQWHQTDFKRSHSSCVFNSASDDIFPELLRRNINVSNNSNSFKVCQMTDFKRLHQSCRCIIVSFAINFWIDWMKFIFYSKILSSVKSCSNGLEQTKITQHFLTHWNPHEVTNGWFQNMTSKLRLQFWVWWHLFQNYFEM